MSKSWVECLKTEVKKSPLFSNAIISFLMVLVEKLVEMDFACPCDPEENAWFSAAYFTVPALFSIALIFCIYSPQCKCEKCPSTSVICTILLIFIPGVVWVTLLLFDGQYFACAKTAWEGMTVHTDISAATTWCQPVINSDHITMKQVEFYSFRNESQKWALGLLGVGTVCLFVCGCCRCCRCCQRCRRCLSEEETKEPKDEEMEDRGPRSAGPPERSALMVKELKDESEQN